MLQTKGSPQNSLYRPGTIILWAAWSSTSDDLLTAYREKRLRTRPGRVRLFKFDRMGRVRDAPAAVSPRVS
eukprot:gene11449-biopygen15417